MFDGARAFAAIGACALFGALLAWPTAGVWGLAGVAVGLYFLLGFFNSLESRDRVDRNKRDRR